MGKSIITRAALFGAAIFISGAGAGWEVAYEAPEYTTLSDLDLDARPTGYCIGYENWYAGGGGPD
ncbi:MAG: hypothetical protein V3W11_06910 [bacterium]|jgi:hypothetical protein